MSIKYLQSRFRFDQNDFPPENDCEILSGPTDIKMNRGMMGKTWMVRRNVYCFKVTIEDGHSNSIDEALETVSRIPLLYLIALEIVSDKDENGMALYKSLGGAAGHGSRTYCNLIGLNLGALIHELGHVIEQEVRLTTESDLLTRWESEAKDVDEWNVSAYGNQNAWEDMAEFCKIYSVALQNDTRKELETLSPNRYKIWTHCLELVSNSLRIPRCETPPPEPIIVDYPKEEDGGNKSQEFDYSLLLRFAPLIIVLIFALIVSAAYFVWVRVMDSRLKLNPQK